MKDLHSWYCTLVVQISNWSNQSRAVQWPDGFSCCSFLSCLINGPSLWICIWNNECIWSVFSNAILILISKISVSFKILWVLCSVVNIWLVFIAPLQILLSHKLDWKKKKSRLSFFKDFENITLKNTQRETSSLETNEVNSHSPPQRREVIGKDNVFIQICFNIRQSRLSFCADMMFMFWKFLTFLPKNDFYTGGEKKVISTLKKKTFHFSPNM